MIIKEPEKKDARNIVCLENILETGSGSLLR
jgi:hypothetical protein